MSLEEFAFQACSFNHSDISPFRVNDLRAIGRQIIARRSANSCLFDITLESSGLRTAHSKPVREIVSDLEILEITYGR